MTKQQNTTIYEFSMSDAPGRPYLKWLSTGLKKAEGRINTQKYRDLQLGDIVIFRNATKDKFIKGSISFKHEYNSFKEMLESEGVSNMLPFLNNNEIQQGIEIYESFPGSERVQQFGCVALGIEIMDFKV